MKTKQELIQRAIESEHCQPQRFIQLDLWTGCQPGKDDVMRGDDDGDLVMFGITDDLRRSDKDLAVRIQVHSEATPADVLRVLKKFAERLDEHVNSGFSMLSDHYWHEAGLQTLEDIELLEGKYE